MDVYEMIRAQMSAAVPFAAHAGVALTKVASGEGAAALEQTATSINHIGSQHAGALFTLGEAASGAAMAGLFADQILAIRPVASEATIAYRKVAKGKISAEAKVAGDPASLRRQLAETGRVAFDVKVAMSNEEGVDVAAITVRWDVRKT